MNTTGRNLKFFREFYEDNHRKTRGAKISGFHLCPCCYLPSLIERNGYEICSNCDWEDDNQNTDQAGEVWGGPNADYSLTEARENYKKHYIMYRVSDVSFDVHNSEYVTSCESLIAAYYDLKNSNAANEDEITDKIERLTSEIINMRGKG